MFESQSAESYSTFGELLAYLRKRGGMTQGELARAVGYSREQITRLEKNQRTPDATVIAARFVPALGLEDEPALAVRLLELARRDGKPLERDAPQGSARQSEQARKKLWRSLPAPLLPLVGRTQELSALKELLEGTDARLITLTGAAGVGKTRLALQAARESATHFANGVCFVSLAPIDDARLVPAAILQVLEPDAAPVADVARRVLDALGDLALLLVLDNMEQLAVNAHALRGGDNHEHAPDAALFVSEILTHAPRVKILVTSRAPLNLYGEFLFPVAPFPVPMPQGARNQVGVNSSVHAERNGVRSLQDLPSVALLVARAKQVQPAFALTDENAGDVAALCIQMDGLPLALELAAAQLRYFAPVELRRGLEANAVTLQFPARNVPERHHSLTNALAWSYNALGADAQTVFAWLGAFAGGATAGQLEDLVPAADVRAQLAELTLISLVQQERTPDGTRYSLFETVRAFARDKLQARGELEAAERRHAESCLALAERIEPHLTGAEQQVWLNRLERERDNLRRALGWSLQDGQPREDSAATAAMALRLCNALWKFWRYRCALAEGYDWTTRALAADKENEATLDLRAGAEWGAGVLAAVMQRDAEASAHLQESLRLWQLVEDDMGVAGALTALGARAMERGEYEHAAALQRQALELYTQLEDAAAMAYAHNALGETARAAGDWQASREHYRASLDLAQQVGHERSIAVAQSNLGSVEIALGDLTTARQRLVKSLPIFMALDDRVNIASCLATLACIDTQANSTAARVRAAQLFGLATRMIQDANGKFETADARDFKYWTAECRAALGEENFERAWDEGSGATVRDAVVWLESPGMRAADLT